MVYSICNTLLGVGYGEFFQVIIEKVITTKIKSCILKTIQKILETVNILNSFNSLSKKIVLQN